MLGAAPPAREQTRAAELIASLCLATDLGLGLPFEHGLRTALIAVDLAERLGVDDDTASQTYYAALLCHAGCTADAHVLGCPLPASVVARTESIRRRVAMFISAGTREDACTGTEGPPDRHYRTAAPPIMA